MKKADQQLTEDAPLLTNFIEKIELISRDDALCIMKEHALKVENKDGDVDYLWDKLNSCVDLYLSPTNHEDFVKTMKELETYIKNAKRLKDKPKMLGFSARFGIRLIYGRKYHGCDENAVPDKNYFEEFETMLKNIVSSAEEVLPMIQGVVEDKKKRKGEWKGKKVDSKLETLVWSLADIYEEISGLSAKPSGPGRNSGKFFRFASSVARIINERRMQEDKKQCMGIDKGGGFRKFVQRTVRKRDFFKGGNA